MKKKRTQTQTPEPRIRVVHTAPVRMGLLDKFRAAPRPYISPGMADVLAAKSTFYRTIYQRGGIAPPEHMQLTTAWNETTTDSGREIDVVMSGPMEPDFWGDDDGDGIDGLYARIANLRDVSQLRFKINSPGGLTDTGLRLYQSLRDLSERGTKVITRAEGMVASAATLPFLAGDEREFPIGARFMTHEPYTFFLIFEEYRVSDHDRIVSDVTAALDGTKQAVSDTLNKVAAIYAAHMKDTTEAEVVDFLKEDYYWKEDEMLSSGLATTTVSKSPEKEEDVETKAKAKADAERMRAKYLETH